MNLQLIEWVIIIFLLINLTKIKKYIPCQVHSYLNLFLQIFSIFFLNTLLRYNNNNIDQWFQNIFRYLDQLSTNKFRITIIRNTALWPHFEKQSNRSFSNKNKTLFEAQKKLVTNRNPFHRQKQNNATKNRHTIDDWHDLIC